ncbi:MAG: class I SAM-dependent methyltransferase [Rhizobacter sp.]|nr:class I SAM-dependent methyltransferase [Rhizobacter sp.]
MNLSRAESYLSAFHDANPGVTSRSFGAMPVQCDGLEFASTYRALISALPDTDEALTLLDLACGDGYLLSLLADATTPQRRALLGVDLSTGELAAARSRLGDRAALYCGKAQQLPLASTSVDVVFSHLALMLMDDVDGVLREVRRVSKPGATFAGLVGAWPPPNPALDAFISLYPAAAQQPAWAGLRLGDRRFRSADGIREMLAPGFDRIEFAELSMARRYTPVQLWDWHLDMYDTDLLTADGREDLRQRYLHALQALCGPQGDLLFEDRYLLFSARVLQPVDTR